jgi:hypothetical protein
MEYSKRMDSLLTPRRNYIDLYSIKDFERYGVSLSPSINSLDEKSPVHSKSSMATYWQDLLENQLDSDP